MIITFTPLTLLKMAFVVILFMLVTGEPVSAQIVSTSKADLKAETKRSRKEAALVEADYKETHLNTVDITYKKGKASQKRAKAQTRLDVYQDEKYSEVIYTEPAKAKGNRKVSLKKMLKTI